MKSNDNKVVYQLLVEDIQSVAMEEIDRELSTDEIESIIDLIAENIPWYDAIASAIEEKIVNNTD